MGHTWDRGWNDLQDTVLVGHPQEVDPEKWLDARPERDEAEVRAFICGMDAIARDLAPKVAATLNLQGCSRLLDLGGGPATYAIAFVRANPQLAATVFDLPLPITIARENIAKHGLERTASTPWRGTSSRTTSARGYDFIWVSQILHSHDEEQCRLIIQKCVQALIAGGTSGHPEFYPQPRRRTPPGAAMFGVHMLAVTPRGRAYTFRRWRSGWRRRAWPPRSTSRPAPMPAFWWAEKNRESLPILASYAPT